ncbi:hypothetical protein MJO28_009338 [Puccinia striiformis f. sp. tritici]|uniref:Uncharacterized protein n=1 Tax=Puccinia striiformis f. sp. tritici TaxID=168172 RepID=A0ACC0E6T1_9BASI|nr:hypothetical protein MJO28_009338 [Puccinia striiformis f. sp. tritici]
MLLERGLSFWSQREITESWRTGEYLGFATKYKPVARKVKPVNREMPLGLNPPLRRPPLSRDTYRGLSRSMADPFIPKGRVTEESLEVVNFGPDDWLYSAELNPV